MGKYIFLLFSPFLIALTSGKVLAQDEEELLWAYGSEDFVSIATGRFQRIDKAPAVASVITADQIRSMGARDLDEALESIAGLHVSRRSAAYNGIYVIRGIHSDFNSQVLFLINGIPITNVFAGDRSQIWGGMPVENISRIEVIRGPGSAVYGADAFAGTINIVTKTANEINGLTVGSSVGSFDTYRGWLQYRKEINEWQIAFSFQYSDTDGQKEIIESDMQTNIDQDLASQLSLADCSLANLCASLAPGSVNLGRETIDSRIDISKGLWRLRAGYQGRQNVESGAGVNQALDSIGSASNDRYNMDINFQDPNFSKNWEVKTTFSYFETISKIQSVLLPPGTLGGASGPFPDGLIGNPSIYERHYRFDESAFYSGFDKHDLRIGFGYHYLDQYRIEESKNFINTLPVPTPLGSVVEVNGADLFNREEEREITYAFIQDEWKLAKDWALTMGLRHDHYSDFGNTTNPRLALVWETTYNLTSKFLYGKAFRAPSFAEQFNQANPVAIGSDDLDPEKIETFELAFNYLPLSDLKIGLNFFYYDFKDNISFSPVAQNVGGQRGQGGELEIDWKISNNLNLRGNYAHQNSEDNNTNSDSPNAPEDQLYINLNYKFSDIWSANAQMNHVANRNRQFGDTRIDIDDYTSIDFTLEARELIRGVDLLISAKNITDEDIREPSLYDALTGSVAIQNDLPQAGRSVMFEIRKNWSH